MKLLVRGWRWVRRFLGTGWSWLGRTLVACYRGVRRLEHDSEGFVMPGSVTGVAVALVLGVMIAIGWLLMALVRWSPLVGVPVVIAIFVAVIWALLDLEAAANDPDPPGG